MSSLKPIKRVMVACVTNEIIKVTDPAMKIGVDRVHLINHVRKAEPGDEDRCKREELYEAVYQENLSFFNEKGIEVCPHRDVEVFRFDACFHAVYEILSQEREKNSAVYVNIASGPPEYAAAAAIASMMVDGVELFTVGTTADGFTIPMEKMRDSLTHNDRLVGTAYKVHDPIQIDKFPLDTPNLFLLKALAVFREVPEKDRSNVRVIRALIKARLWKFTSSSDNCVIGTSVEFESSDDKILVDAPKKTYEDRQRKEAVQYQRSYIEAWKGYGWIEKSEISGKRYKVSKKGERYLDIFTVKK